MFDKDEIDENEFQMIDMLTDHGIDDRDVLKLKDAGIYFCHDLMMQNLIVINGLSEAKFDKIREAAEKIVNFGYITGSDALIKIMEADVREVHRLEKKIEDLYKILENFDLHDGGQKIKERIAKLNLDKESLERDISSFKNLATEPSSPRFVVGHSIYKWTAALTVEPRAPKFTPLDSGSFKLSREGFVLLQFAPAASVRQYDFSRKQVFSLSVTEIGTIMSLCAKDSCEFFHDPFKGKSDEGKFRKVLKVEPLADGSGHSFNLSVQNMLANMDESIYIPVTRGELTVLVSAFNFLIPYLLGWHAYANSI